MESLANARSAFIQQQDNDTTLRELQMRNSFGANLPPVWRSGSWQRCRSSWREAERVTVAAPTATVTLRHRMYLLFVRFVPVMLSGAEEVPCRKPGHLFSHVRADSGRVSVVHSAINTGVEHFLQRV